MKIAILGKGGSGKSTLSWLLVNYLASINKHVLAIDADHNMDLAENLKFGVDSSLKTIHNSHNLFRELVELGVTEKWQMLFNKKINHSFSYPVMDIFTKHITYKVNENIDIVLVGLGQDDILYSGNCAHGHSSPLKFYLPLVQLGKNSHIVVDGVAGTDMVNFGLFVGCDACIVVLENHKNSERVADKILDINKKLNTPTFIVLNKFTDLVALDNIKTKYGDAILGEIPMDSTILTYNYSGITPESTLGIKRLWERLEKLDLPNTDKWKLSQEFQSKKDIVKNKL